MLHVIFAFLPLTVLLAMALITKKMGMSMITATMLAMLLLHKQHFVTGTLDAFYTTLSDSSFQFCLILIVCFGAIIELFQRSGGLQGFGRVMMRFAKGPRSALAISWLMSVILFMDEYLNAITVTFSMRSVTDHYRVPREHLAFQAHSLACSLCMTVPLTSWTAFTVSLMAEHGMGFNDYLKSIPLMLFPVLSIILCLLLAVGLFPKIGPLKAAYERVAAGGPAFQENPDEEILVDISNPESVQETSALNAMIPTLVLVIGTLIFDKDLLAGLLLALIAQFVLYTAQRIMTPGEYFGYFLDGAKTMTNIGIILAFGFTLSRANQELGLFDIIIGNVGSTLPHQLVPLVSFLLVGFTLFAVGGCWVVMLISIPIFIPLALATGVSPVLTVAAVMSGIGMGYSLCFYADSVFMTQAGTGVGNITIIKTTIPYAIILIALTCAGYLALGYMM